MGGLFHQLREREKARRQQFFESCGQHFILSLFPSLTDRPPRFPVSTSLYMCSFMTLCVASDEQPRTV